MNVPDKPIVSVCPAAESRRFATTVRRVVAAAATRSAGSRVVMVYQRSVTFGYHCEECEEAIWPATSRGELEWLRNREHVAREVAGHVQAGLDTWIAEGLDFLDRHRGHSVVLTRRL